MSDRIGDMARGKWRGILASIGVSETFLVDRHGPCPMCGGKDRFRFDNKDGKGTWICNQCGAGDGFNLLMGVQGWDFKQAASEVRGVLGIVNRIDEIKPEMSDGKRLELLRDLWKKSTPVTPGDVSCQYLTGRGIGESTVYPDALRTCLETWHNPSGQNLPAMLALVSDVNGKGVTVHRTFLADVGSASRKSLMPGKLPDTGECIRLSPVQECIGLAEGIETAMAASAMYDLPVWATVNSGLMAKWLVPEGVKEVTIFADNDANYDGHAAAYSLAKRLIHNGVDANVKVYPVVGEDFADGIKKRNKNNGL